MWLDIVNSGLLVLIWLVQLIIYPSFLQIDAAGFISWHKKYVRRISAVVIPLMLAQMILALLLVSTRPGLKSYLMLSGIVIVWASSFSLSVPCHRKLQKHGRDPAVIRRLIGTNWVRTILWTAVFLAGIAL